MQFRNRYPIFAPRGALLKRQPATGRGRVGTSCRSCHWCNALCWALGIYTLLFSGCASFQKGVEKLKGKKHTAATVISESDALDPLGARSYRRFLLEDLSPTLLTQSFKTGIGNGSNEDTARQAFQQGKQLFDQATEIVTANPQGTQHADLFVKAAGYFRRASMDHPDSSIAEDALFMEGESFFFADHYVQSNRAFEGLIADYSGSRYLDQAQQRRFAIAGFWLNLKKNGAKFALNDPKRPKFSLGSEAQRILHRIRIDDPTGKLADDATYALGVAYMNSNRYDEAADTFSYLRQDYPGSEFLFKSQMLELESLLKSYKGHHYDGTALEKSRELVKQIKTQFPNEARQNEELLSQQDSLITNQLAQRDYEVGQFYERRGENRAAQQYYEKVQREFQNSVFQEEAAQRIERVASLPPVPTPPAQWVKKIFPDDESERPIILPGAGLDTILR